MLVQKYIDPRGSLVIYFEQVIIISLANKKSIDLNI
jgi:hypothetical protein